jgi:hypothetical protein
VACHAEHGFRAGSGEVTRGNRGIPGPDGPSPVRLEGEDDPRGVGQGLPGGGREAGAEIAGEHCRWQHRALRRR